MTTLHVTHHGPPDSAATVLWVHGVDSDSRVWDAAIQLVSNEIHCIAADLPGHGESPSPDDAAAYLREAVLLDIDDVITAVRAEHPDRPIVAVGHSLGGYLGLAHVLTRGHSATRLDKLARRRIESAQIIGWHRSSSAFGQPRCSRLGLPMSYETWPRNSLTRLANVSGSSTQGMWPDSGMFT